MDIEQPGIAGHFIRASHERKQVISFSLATAGKKLSLESYWLTNAGHGEILERSTGQRIFGLRRALKRSKHTSHPRVFYLTLIKILTYITAKERRVFSRLDALDIDLLRRWQICPPSLRTDLFISAFRDSNDLCELLDAIVVIKQAGGDEAAIFSELRRARSRSDIARSMRLAVANLSFGPPPAPGDEILTPIVNVAELRKTARELRNCAAAYDLDVLDGLSYFYAIDCDGKRGMVHLEREKRTWLVNDVTGMTNSALPASLADRVLNFFANHGIHAGPDCRPSKWDVVRRVCRA